MVVIGLNGSKMTAYCQLRRKFRIICVFLHTLPTFMCKNLMLNRLGYVSIHASNVCNTPSEKFSSGFRACFDLFQGLEHLPEGFCSAISGTLGS